jgi:hypothetical protein
MSGLRPLKKTEFSFTSLKYQAVKLVSLGLLNADVSTTLVKQRRNVG